MRRLMPRAVLAQPAQAPARGFSLIELMVALSIVGLLMMAGLPHLAEYHGNSRLREGGAALQAEALFAQSEAIKRNRVVRLAINGSTVTVVEAQDPAAPTTLRERVLPDAVQAGTLNIDFSSRGYPVDRSVTPPLDFAAAAVNLAMTGKTCSVDLRCPGLRIDSGGGIRLCADKLSGCT